VPDCPYVIRPSAYALVRNERNQVAVVRTSAGCFLPGGGIEDGESPEQAVEREAMEECGLVLKACRSMATAVEIVYSPGEQACFEKESTFVNAQMHTLTSGTEPDHELVWLTFAEAIEWLSHGSHRWAVQRFGGPAA
jgi:8-oxo-dGTP diphosphatase